MKKMNYNSSRKYKKEEQFSKLRYYKSLAERDRRLFLGQEYKSLGYGSQRYISEVFSCSRITITKGVNELASSESAVAEGYQRIGGGGRKKRGVTE